ncbi:NLR family CARD domain-containing 4 isoform X1 [Pelobates cultripes]|uniref:NLR family CARD domain-containing protein 4 n=2 Tax=Pelobates cultripes TaxID=61616 RepID=A0AAD1VW59_PELCU|nr:NLR family CARD domain-containing 4 isoform X1 [Pelobates cultripes]
MNLIRTKFSELTQRLGRVIAKQIADELYAQCILSMDEMQFVLSAKVDQDVARELVTMILKKGNEACICFLKLLENRDPHFYHDLIGQNTIGIDTKKELEDLSKYLKNLYQSPLFQKFNPLGDETGIDILFDLETTFKDPLLWEKDTLNRKKKQLTLAEILNKLRSPCIIEGEAGKGKTTILKRIALMWATDECKALSNYKLVFFVTLQSASDALYETLDDQLFPINSQWQKKKFMDEIWKLGQEVLFLLDGYDEFQADSCKQIDELIKQNPRFNSTVIVSTRTETIGKVRKFGALIVETSDFTEESAKELIENVLVEDEAKDLLATLEDSIFIKNLMKTPLFVVIACALRMGEKDFQMNTQTALFCTLYELMIERGKYKTSKIKKHIVKENIKCCGNLALRGLFDHMFDFRENHLPDIQEDVLLNIGLLNKYTAQRHRPTYRFFHKSFQEYVAGRRLSQLLCSEETRDVNEGQSYLNRIDSIHDITNKYSNLLLYTCGSSKTATHKVLNHIVAVCNKDITINSIDLAEFGVNLFYESSTKTELSNEFKSLFADKYLYINTNNISSQHFEFFEHLPNCLSALEIIKLELSGICESNPSKQRTPNDQISTYISEKAVKLFFNWNQNLQTLEVTLKNFDKLNRQDIRYLSKICCSARRLRLKIKKSAGVTGAITGILESCRNLQDLIVDHTPLCIEDERRIADMAVIRTLSISNMQLQHQPDGLLCGICKLVNIEKLILENIKMDEKDAQILALGIEKLSKLKILNLAILPEIGKGIEYIARAIASSCPQLEELKLSNCSLTGNALKIISQNLKSLPKIAVLDFSENYLEEDESQSMEELVKALIYLPTLKTLLLPGGSDVKLCLDALLFQLRKATGLSKLAIKRWNLADTDMIKLATHFRNESKKLEFLDLSNNRATSDGWIALMDVLQNLTKLTYLNFSTENLFTPDSVLVAKLSCVISDLQFLCTMELNNWELDTFDLDRIKKSKNMIHRQEETGVHFFSSC